MKNKTKIALGVGAIFMTLALMIFGQHGSMNPADVGFYAAIGAGILWFIVMYFIFKKILKRKYK